MTKRVYKPKPSKKPEKAPTDPPALAQANASELSYQVKPWKMGIRVFGLVLISILSFSLIVSTLTTRHFVVNDLWLRQMLLFALLIILNTSIVLSVFIEVWQVKVTDNELYLRTLLWHSNLAWSDIVWFRHPVYLKIAMLKTKRCVYLLNKQDLMGYLALEQLIESHLTNKARQ